MAKYIIHYALKKGDSENSDLEKKIQIGFFRVKKLQKFLEKLGFRKRSGSRTIGADLFFYCFLKTIGRSLR